MAANTYSKALERLLAHEGGYTNHPSDPGGPTNFGITIYDYRKYILPTATAADIRKMTLDEAKQIYRPKYWDAMRCDELEPGVDDAVFDYGVNSGVGRPGRVLRRILHQPDTSAEFTPDLVEALLRRPAADMVRLICEERARFLHGLRTYPVFGVGWDRRVAEVKAFSLAIAEDLPFVESAPIAPAPARAIDPDRFAKVRGLQLQLRAAGFDPGAIDGDLGPKTIKALQASLGLGVDGVVGRLTRPRLVAALAAAPAAVAAR